MNNDPKELDLLRSMKLKKTATINNLSITYKQGLQSKAN